MTRLVFAVQTDAIRGDDVHASRRKYEFFETRYSVLIYALFVGLAISHIENIFEIRKIIIINDNRYVTDDTHTGVVLQNTRKLEFVYSDKSHRLTSVQTMLRMFAKTI